MGIREITWPLLIGASLLLAGCATFEDKPAASLQGEASTAPMNHKKDFFAARKAISDDYEIIFHIMPAPNGVGFSRTDYHLMVSILQGGHTLTDLAVSSDVRHPDGSFEPRLPMMLMGEWYMAHYNLDHEPGQHFITIAFDANGKHYSSSINYPEAVMSDR